MESSPETAVSTPALNGGADSGPGIMPRNRIVPRSVLAAMGISAVIGAVIFQLSTRLNNFERNMIGTWTWAHAPGEIVVDFRNDGSARYVTPATGASEYIHWRVADGRWYESHPHKNFVDRVFNRTFGPAPQEFSIPIQRNPDDTLHVTFGPDDVRRLIRWAGDLD